MFTFPSFSLRAGSYVKSGKGTNNSSSIYWQQSWYVWNNSGDSAYLRDSKCTLKDSCTWGYAITTSC